MKRVPFRDELHESHLKTLKFLTNENDNGYNQNR